MEQVLEFFKKLIRNYVFLNVMAMIILIVLIFVGVQYGLNSYTRHGEGIAVPDLQSMTYTQAKMLLEQKGMLIMVGDSGHNKKMPADCILAQIPKAGSHVKTGRIIYVTINSPASPEFPIPDIIDNSSSREATAKLTAMGFRLLEPEYVTGEKDWVYGVVSRGRKLSVGDRVPIDIPLRLQIGTGYEGAANNSSLSDADFMVGGDDNFVEVSGPDATDDFIEIE